MQTTTLHNIERLANSSDSRRVENYSTLLSLLDSPYCANKQEFLLSLREQLYTRDQDETYFYCEVEISDNGYQHWLVLSETSNRKSNGMLDGYQVLRVPSYHELIKLA